MASESRPGDARAEVRSPADVRTSTMAKTHDFLVPRLPRETADRLVGEAWNDAIDDAEVSNTTVGDAIGRDEKIVRDQRLGAKPVHGAHLLQVDEGVFYAFFRRLEAKRAVVYGGPQASDVHTAIAHVQERAGELVVVCARAVPRLLSSRTMTRDRREDISKAITTLSTAMRALQVALDAYQEPSR